MRAAADLIGRGVPTRLRRPPVMVFRLAAPGRFNSVSRSSVGPRALGVGRRGVSVSISIRDRDRRPKPVGGRVNRRSFEELKVGQPAYRGTAQATRSNGWSPWRTRSAAKIRARPAIATKAGSRDRGAGQRRAWPDTQVGGRRGRGSRRRRPASSRLRLARSSRLRRRRVA